MGDKEVTCPLCKSPNCNRDGSSALLFVLGWCLPPVSWLLFLLNRNLWCLHCGARFRSDKTGLFDRPNR